MSMRTRIKICGLTRSADVADVVAAGVDAIGLVFYPPSPRAVSLELARELVRSVPPFVSVVGLFVNEDPGRIAEIAAEVPLSLLQFHGDESPQECERFGRPYLKAARMRPGLDLVDYASRFRTASALLLDAFVEGYGGGGHTFDWSLIPKELPLPMVLSGGLSPANVADAIRAVRPMAVDVSSGVESAKGIKDRALVEAFVAGVRNADG